MAYGYKEHHTQRLARGGAAPLHAQPRHCAKSNAV
jgi:hypothetical protein